MSKDNPTILYDGHHWQGREEVERARFLRGLEITNRLSGLVYHPRVELSDARVKYTADFFYVDLFGTSTYEDFKGGHDPRFKDVVRLWAVYGPGILVLTRAKYSRGSLRFEIYDRIVPDVGASNERE